eukprot:760915-Hanusia_phi.AAC.1
MSDSALCHLRSAATRPCPPASRSKETTPSWASEQKAGQRASVRECCVHTDRCSMACGRSGGCTERCAGSDGTLGSPWTSLTVLRRRRRSTATAATWCREKL